MKSITVANAAEFCRLLTSSSRRRRSVEPRRVSHFERRAGPIQRGGASLREAADVEIEL